jgi:hypothetical protein
MERLFIKHLGHQPHLLMKVEGMAIKRCNPGGLLPSVLEGIQAKVGELGGIQILAKHTIDPAGFLGLVRGIGAQNRRGELGRRGLI